MNNDMPICGPDEDKLGFNEMARHLADVFLRNDLFEGFVVGIEGAWGSGKSSLVNLAFDILRKEQGELSSIPLLSLDCRGTGRTDSGTVSSILELAQQCTVEPVQGV